MKSDVVPCYLVCDLSLSMTDHIDHLNAGIREFLGAAHADSSIGDRIRCCVVGFADTPRVLQPLQPLHPVDMLAELPEPGYCVGTNYGPVFTHLRDAIDQDVRLLRAQRLCVGQPIVLFVSDGQPTDPVTWPAAFATLTDPNWADKPNVIAFGIGDADQDTLGRIGTFGIFLARDGVRISTALIASMRSAPPDPVQAEHDLSTSGPHVRRTLSGKGDAMEIH